MVLKERIDKSQIHFYINKILSRGFVKVSDIKSPYVYTVTFEKRTDRIEHLTLRYTRNGWLTIF